MRKTALGAVSKKAAGQVFSIVLLADDLKEAWQRLEGHLNASD